MSKTLTNIIYGFVGVIILALIIYGSSHYLKTKINNLYPKQSEIVRSDQVTITWQGIVYPHGCLTCDINTIYSPVFDNFDDCKTWALNKKSFADDKISCGKNCQNPEYGGQICEEVVRNWLVTPESFTFDNYSN